MQHLIFPAAQVQLPNVVGGPVRHRIIEVFALFVERVSAQVSGKGRKTYDAFLDTVQFHDDVFRRITLFFGIVWIAVLGRTLFGLLVKCVLLLVHLRDLIGSAIQEYGHHVMQRPPRSVAAQTVAIRREENRVPVRRPYRLPVEITRVGDVMDRTALSADEADVGIGMVTVARIAQGEPLAVGGPCVIHTSVGGIRPFAVGDPADLAAGKVQHHQPATFFHKGQLFSVGGVLRAGSVGFPGFEQRLFFDDRRIRKIGIFVPDDRRRVDVPITVAFRSVGQRAVVRSEIGIIFGFRGRRDASGRVVSCRCHENLAAGNEGDLFAVGGNRRVMPLLDRQPRIFVRRPVGSDLYVEFPG